MAAAVFTVTSSIESVTLLLWPVSQLTCCSHKVVHYSICCVPVLLPPLLHLLCAVYIRPGLLHVDTRG